MKIFEGKDISKFSKKSYYHFNNFFLNDEKINFLLSECEKYNLFKYSNNEIGIIISYKKVITSFVF